MSQQALRILLNMDQNRLYVQLALQCAPFLAGIKVSNLFIVEERYWLGLCWLCRNTDICVRRLYYCRGKVTLLMYRKKELEEWLNMPETYALLIKLGYENGNLHHIFTRLEEKIGGHGSGEMPFPHELGLILGYPPEDVEGFLENGGKKCLYTGYWKVYAHLEEKLELFWAYDRAVDKALSMAYQREDVMRLKDFF